MNTEAAIKVLCRYHDSVLLKTHLDFLQNPQNYQTNGVPNQFICDTESVRLALELGIEALKQYRPSPANAPLTLDELREMDGEPVYLVVESKPEPLKMWALIWVDVESDGDVYFTNNLGGQDGYRTDEGLHADGITAYRYPPATK